MVPGYANTSVYMYIQRYIEGKKNRREDCCHITLTLPGPSAGVSGSVDSYCLKTLMLGHGGSSAGSYLADPTSPIPSHCAVITHYPVSKCCSASIVMTSTVRVNYFSICIFLR